MKIIHVFYLAFLSFNQLPFIHCHHLFISPYQMHSSFFFSLFKLLKKLTNQQLIGHGSYSVQGMRELYYNVLTLM